MEEAVDVQRGLALEVDGVGDAADGDVLDVRGLAAEHGHDLVGVALVFERLQVVRDGDEVDLSRELHGRTSPIPMRERSELTASDETCHALLHGGHLLRRWSRRKGSRQWRRARGGALRARGVCRPRTPCYAAGAMKKTSDPRIRPVVRLPSRRRNFAPEFGT